VYLSHSGSLTATQGVYDPQLAQRTDVTSIAQHVSSSSNLFTFAMAVRQDGSLALWGNLYMEDWWHTLPVPSFGASDPVVSVAVGKAHAVALLESGSVLTWGWFNATVPYDIQAGGASAVAAGYFFSLALKAGQVYAWGDEDYGDGACNLVADIQDAALTDVVKISATHQHALVLLANGTVRAWGCNDYNQADVPQGLLAAAGGVADIAAGPVTSLALPKAGPVVGWGFIIVNGDLSNVSKHANVTSINTVMLSAGWSQNAAVLKNKSIVVWDDWSGMRATPPQVQGAAVAVSSGFSTCIALVTAAAGAGSPGLPSAGMAPPHPTVSPLPSMDVAAPGNIPGIDRVVCLLACWCMFVCNMSNTHEPYVITSTHPHAGVVVGWGGSTVYGLQGAPSNVTGGGRVSAVAAGYGHALVLGTDGRVTLWGRNDSGQQSIPSQALGGRVKAISTQYKHSLALLETGEVLCWGDNSYGQCNVTEASAASGGARAIKATISSSFAQLQDGSWVLWGGDSYAWDSYSSDAGGTADLVDVCDDVQYASNGLYLVLLANGLALSVGGGDATLALPALANVTIKSICSSSVSVSSVGADYALALDEHGNVWGWGTTSSQGVWHAVPDDIHGRVVEIVCGFSYAIAKLTDGSFRTWGPNVPQGQPPANARNAAAGYGFSLYLTNTHNVLQTGILSEPSSIGVKAPPSLDTVRAISSKGFNAVALASDGSVVSWGMLETSINAVPSQLQPGNTPATAVSIGPLNNAIALLENGFVVTWGDAQVRNTVVPPEASAGNVVAVAAGDAFSLALTADGGVVAWLVGADRKVCTKPGQSNILRVPPQAQSGVTAIAAGESHALAIKDGSVVAWGCDDYFFGGPLKVPLNATSGNVVAISVGYRLSLALLSTGAVVAWGCDGDSEIGCEVPDQAMSNVTAIAAGDNHAVALKSDGTVVSWGDNSTGQLDVPPEFQGRVMAIAAHASGTLAIVQPSSPPPTGALPSLPIPTPAGKLGLHCVFARHCLSVHAHCV
jgi:alpha-tubulin suppressor-like RCC1 family protein